MQVTFKQICFYVGVLVLVALVGVVAVTITRRQNEAELARLRNEVATRDQTIEVQKGVYTKLSVETEELQVTLDRADQQVSDLANELRRTKQDLLATNSLVVKWKKAYEGAAKANQTEVPGKDPGTIRKKVDFSQDFSTIRVSGWTLTDPAQSWLKVEQLKPLDITLVISQDKSGAWRTYATSSDPNTSVDIKLAAVNPHLLERKWHQKIRFSSNVAVGSTAAGAGLLLGLGASYEIGKFDVGPSVFLGISDRVDKYVGVNFGWRPF